MRLASALDKRHSKKNGEGGGSPSPYVNSSLRTKRGRSRHHHLDLLGLRLILLRKLDLQDALPIYGLHLIGIHHRRQQDAPLEATIAPLDTPDTKLETPGGPAWSPNRAGHRGEGRVRDNK